MRYRLTDANGRVLYWDTNTSTFLDQFGNTISLLNRLSAAPFRATDVSAFNRVAYCYNDRQREKKYYPNLDRLYRLKIQLGMSCNESCVYCSQRVCREEPVQPTNGKLETFLTKLAELDIPWGKLNAVELWGGEPFVYWKQLKPTVEYLRDSMGYNNSILVTTNGTLFTKEIADWCGQYNLKIKFSHDGVNHKYQRSLNDWLDNPSICENVRNYLNDHVGLIACEFSPLHDVNLYHSLDLFRERLGTNASIMFDGAFWCDKFSSYLLAGYTQEKIDKCGKYWYNILMDSIDPTSKYYTSLDGTRYLFAVYLRRLVRGQLTASLSARCNSKSNNILTFDFDGNSIPCQGAVASQGLGGGSIDDPTTCYDTGFKSLHHRKNCPRCPYALLCGGPCGWRSDDEETIYCKSVRWSYAVMFKAAVKVLFDFDLERIEEVA